MLSRHLHLRRKLKSQPRLKFFAAEHHEYFWVALAFLSWTLVAVVRSGELLRLPEGY